VNNDALTAAAGIQLAPPLPGFQKGVRCPGGAGHRGRSSAVVRLEAHRHAQGFAITDTFVCGQIGVGRSDRLLQSVIRRNAAREALAAAAPAAWRAPKVGGIELAQLAGRSADRDRLWLKEKAIGL